MSKRPDRRVKKPVVYAEPDEDDQNLSHSSITTSPAKRTSTSKKETKTDSDDENSSSDEAAPLQKKAKKQKKNPLEKEGKRKVNGSGITKKCIDIKLKAASLDELRAFVRKVVSSPTLDIIAEFTSFSPKAIPIEPSKDDPLLTACCVCLSMSASHEFSGVAGARLCSHHHQYFVNEGKGFTRESLCHTFGFSKKEADAVPHKAIVGGFYRSKIFIYQLTTSLRAAVKKYGSLYMMMRHRYKPASSNPSLDDGVDDVHGDESGVDDEF